jgi:ubiquinone/menaquinone biosynthesis C-methylase UbiE
MKDNFSRQADIYAKYRPEYPQEVFDFIFSHIKEKKSAWDCATGNGQAAKELAKAFEKVYATDISQKQLDNAVQADNIIYSVQPGEKTNFADNSFDLVTISQALHWMKFEIFYAEVRRVARPGAWFAGWMYSLLQISPEIDALIHHHHFETLKDHWDYERKYVDDNYSTIPFPFEEIKCPMFQIRYNWTLEELEGYLNTWSALQKLIKANNTNPVDDLIKKISPYWTRERMHVLFPIHLRMGKILK